jgi:hypothetical protein
MDNKQILLDALLYYNIEVIDSTTNKIKIGRDYCIEVEQNGLYKLSSNGQVVAPFDDLDELCRFVLL